MGSAKLAQVYCTGIQRHRMTSTLLTAKDPSVADLLGLLRDGLPRAAEGSGRSIVVVGAGIAGLVAGWLLRRAGHRVTLLEARTRMGGRILTHRRPTSGMFAEFGAMRFPRQHPLGQYLIHDLFGLRTAPFPMHNDASYLHLQGQTIRSARFADSDLAHALFLGTTPQQLLDQALAPLHRLFQDHDEDTARNLLLERYDKLSLIQYLERSGFGVERLALIGPLLGLEGRYHFSLVEWYLHHRADLFDDLEYIVDGADRLITSFEPLLGDVLHLGCAVEGVDPTGDGVLVHYRSAFTRQSLEADACILTLPFCLMRTMEIGGMDPAKSYAIRNCYYGRAHKIFMQFRWRWWECLDGISHGTTTTDLGIRTIVYTPAGQDRQGGRGMLLVSYAWENDSATFAPLSEEQRLAQALEDLCRIHPAARESYEWGMSHDWSQDPWSGGIGPLFRPLEMTGPMFHDLIRPLGRIHFANDACDRYHRRWIEGSIAAAIRTALAVHHGEAERPVV